MIYYPEETFICGSVARLCQTKADESVYRDGLASPIIISRRWPTGKLYHYRF